MNIGEAATASGVSAKMIRYYESTGLIRPARRHGSGAYRTYEETDVHTLRFIRKARDLGFSVTEIAGLLRLWQDRARASADVKALVQVKIAELKAKIAELVAMERTLHHLADCCQGDSRPDCPILDDLAGEDHASPSAPRKPGFRPG
jgi:MerR family transcriptional regulator, copper efflux regulator